MSVPSSIQIRRLYKDLLRYGQELKYTDKPYFYDRIKKEFKSNKLCTNTEEILFNFEVRK